jgi:hypothetical protein
MERETLACRWGPAVTGGISRDGWGEPGRDRSAAGGLGEADIGSSDTCPLFPRAFAGSQKPPSILAVAPGSPVDGLMVAAASRNQVSQPLGMAQLS